MGASWADHKFKKSLFWSVISLILRNNNEPFLDRDCDLWWKVDFYTTGDDQLSDWT